MDFDQKTFERIIAERLEELQTNAFAVEQSANLTKDAIRSVIRPDSKRSLPRIDKAQKICEALGLEFYIGPRRPMTVAPTGEEQNQADQPIDDFAFVQRFDVQLSAGPGQIGDNARKLAPVAFRKAWLREQGLRADGCVVTGIVGNSMEPLLFDGDLVLLNTQQTEVRSGQVYGIVDTEGDLRMKRIEKISEGIILRSENIDCPSELRLGDDANRVRIIGTLAWSGHTHKTLHQFPRGAAAENKIKNGLV